MEHSVNVLHFAEARASEIASMMDEMDSSNRKRLASFQRLPHYMRRRAASQNPNRVPRGLQNPNKQGQSKVHKKYKKKDKRRKFADKDSYKSWLETHVWHAKRFKMDTRWGYRIPFHPNALKKGAAFKEATKRCIIQDLSYYSCIELKGPQKMLLSKLSSIGNPKERFYSFEGNCFLDGSKEGRCFLYQPNSAPFKAIGPVTFMWEPQSKQETRKLWIWCHPSIHDELVRILATIFELTEQPAGNDPRPSFACKLNMGRTKPHFMSEVRYTSSASPVSMTLLRSTLFRHRLMGSKASEVLSRALRMADVDGLSCSEDPEAMKTDDETAVGETSPSYWWKTYYAGDNGNREIHDRQKEVLDFFKNAYCHEKVMSWSVIGVTVRDPRCGRHWNGGQEEEHVSDLNYCTPPPNDLEMTDVAVSPIWCSDIRNEVTATKVSEIELNAQKQKSVVPPELGDRENKVPILLIHRPSLNGIGSGWDVIGPLGWSMEFWMSYKKCEWSTGLLDLEFLNNIAGRPNFPRGFPDTAAGKLEQLARENQGVSEQNRRPKSQRINFDANGVPTPFTVHWEVLLRDSVTELQSSVFFPQELIKSVAGKGADTEDFYVLQDWLELSGLQNRVQKVEKCSEQQLQELLDAVDHFLGIRESCFFRSLVLVKIDCSNKGTPSEHAGLYLLSEDDRVALMRDFKFGGPVEPSHVPAKKKKDGNPENTGSKEEKSKIDSYIGSCSRKMIGYLSAGCFSSQCGRGVGLGHCTSVGYVILLKQCAESRLRPVVLFRNQNNLQFRVAKIELIEDYL